jgi:hypothetical protein
LNPCWINVYQRPNGEQLVGGSCFGSRELAATIAQGVISRRVCVLKVTPKLVDNAAVRP